MICDNCSAWQHGAMAECRNCGLTVCVGCAFPGSYEESEDPCVHVVTCWSCVETTNAEANDVARRDYDTDFGGENLPGD